MSCGRFGGVCLMAGGTASWHQVGAATSPAGPCPTARPSVGLASGLKPRLSRGMPEAVSFASKVCSMSSCACERSVSPKLLRAPRVPCNPQHTSLRQGNRGNNWGNRSPGQVLPGAGGEAAQLPPRVPFPGAEGPVSTPRHASPAAGGARGGPSPPLTLQTRASWSCSSLMVAFLESRTSCKGKQGVKQRLPRGGDTVAVL